MGARLSQPKGPDGISESSVPAKAPPPPTPRQPFPRLINGSTIVAPLAAFTMACLLFVYTRTSIRAAKANAQRHRDADSGGEGLNLLNEHYRRHGVAPRLERGGGTVGELAGEAREQLMGVRGKREEVEHGDGGMRDGRSEEEEKLRAMKGRRGRKGEVQE